MRHNLGAHVSIAGGHHLAVEAAAALGMQTVQVFTKSSNQWKAKPLGEGDIQQFRAALTRTGIVDPVAHTSYLINLASPDSTLWQRSIDSMTIEVERAEALGVATLVVHPGAHMACGEEQGLGRVARALDDVHRRTRGFSVRVALESTAGQGSCLGHRLEHLSGIIQRTKAPERLCVCLDSCHLFAAGYDLAAAAGYNAFLEELGATVGTSLVRVWHLNDSAKPRGSRVDRHAGIGRGLMGLEALRRILNEPAFASVPMILETPKGFDGDVPLDVLNLQVLRSLEQAPASAGKPRKRGKKESRAS
jgi:deoxyribonuclease-4